MARTPLPPLYKTVFLSVNNSLTPMSDTQARVLEWAGRSAASSITGMALAGHDRWLCLLEGDQPQVSALVNVIKRHERSRPWTLLMTEPRAKLRMFPQHRLGWQNHATPLEMAAFLSDLRRLPSRSQVWHASHHETAALLEPVE